MVISDVCGVHLIRLCVGATEGTGVLDPKNFPQTIILAISGILCNKIQLKTQSTSFHLGARSVRGFFPAGGRIPKFELKGNPPHHCKQH